MTATDELRRMLDERGVEWWQKKRHTCWKVGKGQEVEMWRAWEAPDGSLTLKVDYIYHLTPEQAIAATLGRGECHMHLVYEEEDADGFIWPDHYECDACGANVNGIMPSYDTEIQPRFCPTCGRKVVGATTNAEVDDG